MTMTMMKSKGHELLTSSKDFPVFKASVSRLIQDSTPEARAYCRDIVKILIDQQVVSRYEWEQLIPAEILEKALSSTGGGGGCGITSSTGQVMSTVGSSKQSGVLNNYNQKIHDSPHRSSNARGKRDKSHMNEEQLLHNHLLSPYVSHNPKSNVDLHSLIKSTDKMSNSVLDQVALTSTSFYGSPPPTTIINNTSTATVALNNKPVGSMYLDTGGTEDLLRGGPLHQQLPSNRKHHHQAPLSSTTATSTASINSIIDTKNALGMISPNKMDLAMTMNAKRFIEQDQELSNLSELLQNTTVRAWTERNVALDSLTALMIRHCNILRDANKLSCCLEHILNRLEDGMVKVW